MSRRKQSNPKPLKVDEGWSTNEADDGTKKDNQGGSHQAQDEETNKREEDEEGRDLGGEEGPSSSPTEEQEEGNTRPGRSRSSVEESHSSGGEESDGDRHLVGESKKDPKKGRGMGQTEMGVAPLTTRSKSRGDLGEFGESHFSESEEVDDRRKRSRVRDSSSSRSPPAHPDSLGGSRSQSNGSPSLHHHNHPVQLSHTATSSNNAPLTSQQLLQRLPYLQQLLPPDAARLFLMPPFLAADLSALGGSVPPGSSSSNPSSSLNHEKSTSSDYSRTALGFLCQPCGIKFSSARTLEAHQSHYCSFRIESGNMGKGELSVDEDFVKAEASSSSGGSKKRERESGDEELMEDHSGDVNLEMISNLPVAKSIKSGKIYQCMHCSYSADKKVSLNRHMRIHSGLVTMGPSTSRDSNDDGTGSDAPISTNMISVGSNIGMNKNLPEGVNALERYCRDCDIQFSSIKTFRVHKQHYCNTRHVMKNQVGSVGNIASPTLPGTSGSGGRKSVGLLEGGGGSVTPVMRKSGGGGQLDSSGSPIPSECSPVSTPGPHPPPSPLQPYVVLPTNPIIAIPYSFIQAATILPANAVPSHNALVVLPNGFVHGLPSTNVPISIPSPSLKPSSSTSSTSFHGVKNNGLMMMNHTGNGGVGSSSNNGSGLSPSQAHHSVFNDPKEMLRKLSVKGRNGGEALEAGDSSGTTTPGPSGNGKSHQSVSGEKVNGECFEGGGGSSSNEEEEGPSPAIDLTLRKVFVKKEMSSGDDEKENRETLIAFEESQGSEGEVSLMKRMSSTPQGSGGSEFQRDIRSSSPAGGGSCGKRTPRPSSTSMGSSICSTPPALGEPKINGIRIVSPHKLMDVEEDRQSLSGGQMMMMSAGGVGSPFLPEMCLKKSSPGDLTSTKQFANAKRNSKMRVGGSPIATQLPGGAILTTTSGGGSGSLADLLGSGSSSELSPESLAKLVANPQVLINGSPMIGGGMNPVLLQALSQSDPELVMRMLDPLYLNSIHQQLQQQQQQQSGVKRAHSKCVECDIIFYKHENYVVHKEHYCAARTGGIVKESGDNHVPRKERFSPRLSSVSPARSENDLSGGLDESSSPPLGRKGPKESGMVRPPRKSTDSSSSDFFPQPVYEASLKSKSRSSPHNIQSCSSVSPVPSPKDDGMVGSKEVVHIGVRQTSGSQHPCGYCGVPFSSLGNLNAHQSFYCTKRQKKDGGSVSTPVGPQGDAGKDEGTIQGGRESSQMIPIFSGKGLICCGKCKLSIPEDQMGSHGRVCIGSTVTNGDSGRMGGWKCPCCDVYSPTVSAAQKHLEIHSGVRAFKCRICGYRGNTLRGMRTHIRTHFDKKAGGEVLEAEYMTCITAQDLEGPGTSGGRSYHEVSRSSGVPATMNHVGESRRANRSPVIERQEGHHNKQSRSPSGRGLGVNSPPGGLDECLEGKDGADEVENNNSSRLNYCRVCNYSSAYRAHVLRHMKLVHKISGDGDEVDEQQTEKVEESGDDETDECVNGKRGDEGDSGGSVSLQKKEKACAVKYCKSCNIDFNHLATFNAHKKGLCCGGITSEAAERAETPVQ